LLKWSYGKNLGKVAAFFLRVEKKGKKDGAPSTFFISLSVVPLGATYMKQEEYRYMTPSIYALQCGKKIHPFTNASLSQA
jgi:hypothetical protein